MPRGRWVHESENFPPVFRRPKTDVIRKRGNSTAPNWTQRPEWSQTKPTGEWGAKSVDKWRLLPPYDTGITEQQWKVYYDERSSLDKVNTVRSDESDRVWPEDLEQDPWYILAESAKDVAVAILGSNLDDEERKKEIARTLLGSLYLMDLAGCNESAGDGPDPRQLDARTRLYSPFGIGTSIDFHYDYYFRLRYSMDNERSSSLNAVARKIVNCSVEDPCKCAAAPESDDEEEVIGNSTAACTLFDRMEEMSQIVPENVIKVFEEPLFGCKGWLSPMKLVDLLLAAGTVMQYEERDMETPQSFQDKLYYFEGESKGKGVLAQGIPYLAQLEEDLADDNDMVCIPFALLNGVKE
ncbi:hypothetical protein BDV93DRAFT_522267 [Ceratobasidium sp. AG-I]|nr:hypothetical protein BDV93DRAFT_522267 [Ceratobasidium sp. AG-I]